MGVGSERSGSAAARTWHSACDTLLAPAADAAWEQVVGASPADTVWHSLRNCVSYQAGVWQNLLSKGIVDVIQPAAFKLAIVLRHTPSELTVRLLADLLQTHPQSQDLTSYVLALLTDDEAQWCGSCGAGASSASPVPGAGAVAGATCSTPPGPPAPTPAPGLEPPAAGVPTGLPTVPGLPPTGPRAPLRDLQLYGDCELAILAASREEYDAHAKLVRAEYSKLNNHNYVELRIKVLNQFSQIPKLFHTPEFECFEAAARENIEREICTLREHLLTGRKD